MSHWMIRKTQAKKGFFMTRSAFFLAMFFCLLFNVSVYAAGTGIVLQECIGEVLIRPDDDHLAWDIATNSQMIGFYNHVRTSKSSQAIVLAHANVRLDLNEETEIIANNLNQDLFSATKIIGAMRLYSISKKRIDLELSQVVVGIDSFNEVLDEEINFVDKPEAAMRLAYCVEVSTSDTNWENTIKAIKGDLKILIRETQKVIDLEQGYEMSVRRGAKIQTRKIEP